MPNCCGRAVSMRDWLRHSSPGTEMRTVPGTTVVAAAYHLPLRGRGTQAMLRRMASIQGVGKTRRRMAMRWLGSVTGYRACGA